MDFMQFTIQLQILRIHNEYARDSQQRIRYENPILFTSPIKYQQFTWKISGDLMEKMHAAYPGKIQFICIIYNDINCK